jgi:hypothetical protein
LAPATVIVAYVAVPPALTEVGDWAETVRAGWTTMFWAGVELDPV